MDDRPDRIGPYEVEREIGRGGMGVVYLARDEKLGRDVAIKALPAEVAADPDRLARFRREAKLLAALHHSNVAVVYGLEETDGVLYLVLEHVEGDDLDARLKRGAIAADDAISVGRQIAEALEAAHGSGIIHRDLKASNVKLTPGGRVKVLDFGLAKAVDERAAADLLSSPTVTVPHSPTDPGVILGTAGYMSPEQARGKPVDKRTDIWSFGCVLYETLAGRPAFGGESVSDCIAATLRGEPEWEALPAETPPRVTVLLRRCLARDPDRRLHDIADARVELEDAANDTAIGVATVTRRPKRRSRGATAAAVLAVLLVASLAWNLRGIGGPAAPARHEAPTRHVAIAAPLGESIRILGSTITAISPDGMRIAYVSTPDPGPRRLRAGRYVSAQVDAADRARLLVRSLEEPQPRALAGTEDAVSPFFSPDGRWIGFFAADGLYKVPFSGGVPVKLAPSTNGVGGDWGRDGTIVYAPHWSSGLWRIDEDGGEPEMLTTLDPLNNEAGHRWPRLLPDGKSVVFTVKRKDLLTFDDAQIAVASLETGEHRIVLEGGMSPRYVSTGHLLFCRGSAILAAPFDLDRLRVTGSSVPVVEGVESDEWDGSGHFDISATGSLLYVPAGPDNVVQRTLDLVSVDRQGVETAASGERRPYGPPVISPDGTRVALFVSAANGNLWIAELAGGSFSRLTFGQGNNLYPVWTPDGKRIAFFSDRDSAVGAIYWMLADGSEPAEPLVRAGIGAAPSSFSPDGSVLLFMSFDTDTGEDVWHASVTGAFEPAPLVATRFSEGDAEFSPDGGWFAFTSNESGRNEVYVRPYPGPGGKTRVSFGGGWSPRWSPDGAELYFLGPEGLAAVEIDTEGRIAVGEPGVLFDTSEYQIDPDYMPAFDVAPDGRFLFAKIPPQVEYLRHLNLVLDWFEEPRRVALPHGETR